MGQLLSKNIPQDGAALGPSTASSTAPSTALKPSAPELPKAESKMSTPELIAKKRRYVPRKERKLKKQKLAHRKSQMLDLFTSFLFHRYVKTWRRPTSSFWKRLAGGRCALRLLVGKFRVKAEVKKRYEQFATRGRAWIFMALNKQTTLSKTGIPKAKRTRLVLERRSELCRQERVQGAFAVLKT